MWYTVGVQAVYKIKNVVNMVFQLIFVVRNLTTERITEPADYQGVSVMCLLFYPQACCGTKG